MKETEIPTLKGRRYEWDKWLRKKGKFILKQGEDFNGREYSFVGLFRIAAKERGYKISARIEDGRVICEVTERPNGRKK